MKKRKVVILASLTAILILVIISAIGGYWIGKANPNIKYNDASQQKVKLDWKEVVLDGVTEEEGRQIEALVDKFEGYKQEKDPDKLLSLFTLAETTSEQWSLDFILGNDNARDNEKPLSRLFSTQSYNHSLGAYYVRSIKKRDELIIVSVDELRIFYVGLAETGYSIGYSAGVSSLVLEIQKENNGYKIRQYYHPPFSKDLQQKYEGFSV